jgi:hypothetical protein
MFPAHEERKERTDFIQAYSRRDSIHSTFQRERRPNLWGIAHPLSVRKYKNATLFSVMRVSTSLPYASNTHLDPSVTTASMPKSDISTRKQLAKESDASVAHKQSDTQRRKHIHIGGKQGSREIPVSGADGSCALMASGASILICDLGGAHCPDEVLSQQGGLKLVYWGGVRQPQSKNDLFRLILCSK